MKKLFLLTITAGLSISSFAQSAISVGSAKQVHGLQMPKIAGVAAHGLNRTTSFTHDSLVLDNRVLNDTIPQYYTAGLDSGYLFGNSAYQFDAFAERYDFTAADSSIEVLGVLAAFTGAVNPSSTENLTFNTWTMGSPVVSTPLIYSGFPDTVLASVVVPFTSLTLNNYGAYWFTSPTAYLTSSHFFVGFTLNYTWGSIPGDTVSALISTQRLNSVDSIIGPDTLVNDQSVIGMAGSWLDNGFDIGINGEYYMFPIVNTQGVGTTGIKGITNKKFTFYSVYPNPAVTNTNVRFSLATAADVTIQITDMSGRVINTSKETNLAAGEHITGVNTTGFAAGDYLLVIHASNGGGLATKLTVIK